MTSGTTFREKQRSAKLLSVARVTGLVGLVFLCVFAVTRFAYDVTRLFYPVNDLTPIWVSSKAFVSGHNPYDDMPEFEKIWAGTGVPPQEGCADYNCLLHKYPMGYPPSALPLLAPFSLLNLKGAVYLYLCGSIILFAAVVIGLSAKQKTSSLSLKWLYFIAFVLAMAPLHAGVHHSNLNTIVIALLGLAAIFMEGRPVLAGLALGIGMCLKPQVAFLFFAYPWLKKRWRCGLTAVSFSAAVTFASVLFLISHHINVIRTYLDSLHRFMPPGGINSFYMASPKRYTMINLQVLMYQFTHNVFWSNLVSWILFAMLAITSVILVRSRRPSKNDGSELAIIAILTLLPVYQQIYTAAILMFVALWAVANLPKTTAKAALVFMVPLLFPLVAMTWSSPRISTFIEAHHFSSSFLWNAFLMPHVIWIELLLLTAVWGGLYERESVASPTAAR